MLSRGPARRGDLSAIEVYTCAACDLKLEPDDRVVVAARQVAVTARNQAPYYMDSAWGFFHERCFKPRSTAWAERDRGELRSFRPGAT